MKTFAIAALAGITQAVSTGEYQFIKYATKFAKEYKSSAEFRERLVHFLKSEEAIMELNSRNTAYTAGHNQFSDWSEEEYLSMASGVQAEDSHHNRYALFAKHGASNSDSLDWRDVDGVVTPVKDQGSCGSCWAFSATEAIESAYVIAGNDQVIMAPQELVDCTMGPGPFFSQGCNGGWYFYAYRWLGHNLMMTEEDYPYTSGITQTESTCAYDAAKGVTGVSESVQVAPDTDSIKAAIGVGPVNVAVAAGNNVFRYYTSGIITADDGCPTEIDHAIVAVGYGYEGDQGYYIVRNSWNTTWGDQGFAKIGMEDGDVGVCGINGYVYYPLV